MTLKRLPKAYERSQSGIDKMVTTWTILTCGSFYSPRKALDIFPGARPITDAHFIVCFIGLDMHFGFEKIKKKLYFIEQWEL